MTMNSVVVCWVGIGITLIVVHFLFMNLYSYLEEIQTYLSDWADKLGLPEDKRIANYITHIFEKDFIQKEFDPEIAKLIQDRVPGSVYDPFLEKRLGKLGYVEDTWRALDAYVKRATRKFHMDQALDGLSAKAEKLESSQFDYVKNYVDRINLRPTKVDNMIDNTLKSLPGVGYRLGQRPTASLSRTGRQAVYRGTLGFNIGSALKNLTQGVNTYAELGEKYTLKGYTELVKNIKSSELEDVGVLRDNFIQDRTISTGKQLIQKMDRGLFALFETAERINRGSAYYGAKAKALDGGMDEQQAIEFARDVVRKTQFTFGSVDTPVALQSDLARTLAQLQSFTIKQGEFLGEKITKKEWAGMMRYMGGSLVIASTIGQLFGMDWKDFIPSLRFGPPPTLQPFVETAKAALNVPDKFGNEQDLEDKARSIAKTAIPFIPAGSQVKKTIEGFTTAKQGFATSRSGKVQHLVDPSAGNIVRGSIFGKSALPGRQDYFDTKQSVLGDVQSEDVRNAPPEERKAIVEGIKTRREVDNAKEKAIELLLAGDREGAKKLREKTPFTITSKELETKAKNQMLKHFVNGRIGEAKKINMATGVPLKNSDLEKAYKKEAIRLLKLGSRSQALKVKERANAEGITFTISNKELE